MLKQNQNGFSPIIIVGLILVLGVAGFAGYRVMNNDKNNDPKNTQQTSTKQGSENGQTQKNNQPEKDIELQNFGLASLDSIEITSNALREFDSKGMKGFYVFGDKLPGNRQNPNFEYSSLKADTQAVSSIDGIIVNINAQTDNAGADFEVFIKPSEDSYWIVAYDHLVNLKVKKGDKVKAGQVLGEPATQNNGALRFEMQINKEIGSDATHVCPSTILAPDKKEKLLAELKTVLNSWESQTGKELYNTESQNPVGCIKPTLTPAEAEGR